MTCVKSSIIFSMIFLKNKGIINTALVKGRRICHIAGCVVRDFHLPIGFFLKFRWTNRNSRTQACFNIRAVAGQAFLSMTILVGGIVVAAGIFFAFFVASFIDSGYGLQASYVAEATATAGVEDAILQLSRNGAFSGPSGYSTPYTIPVGSNTASVTINAPSSGLITILSVSTVSLRIRKITAVVSEDSLTNQIKLVSWQETQ